MSRRSRSSGSHTLEPNFAPRVIRSLRDGSWPGKVWRRCQNALKPDRFELPEVRFREELHRNDEIIFDDICLPPYYGPDDHDDITPLFALLCALKPLLVIEFGTAQGNITANICRQTEAKVLTVNAPPESISGGAITFTLTRDEIGRVYRRYGFEARVNQIFANTLQVDLAEHVVPLGADVGIIDACHDYEFVLNDFLKVAPFIRPGGLVLLHDTHPGLGPPRDGSYEACRHLREEGWDIRHVRETWWGLWVRGGIRCSPVERLLIPSRNLRICRQRIGLD